MTVQPINHKLNGKDGVPLLLYVTSLFLLIFSVLVIRHSVTLVTDKMSTYGDEWSGVNFADDQDGLYNAEKAKTEFAKAKASFKVEGVQFPIHLDLPVDQSSKLNVAQAQSLKQTVEKHWVVGKMSLSISTNCHLMICKMQPMCISNALQKTGIFQTVWFGVQTISIHQLYLDIFKTTSSENTRLSWVMMIQTMHWRLK